MTESNTGPRRGHASVPLAKLDRRRLAFGPVRIVRESDRVAFAAFLRERRRRRD